MKGGCLARGPREKCASAKTIIPVNRKPSNRKESRAEITYYLRQKKGLFLLHAYTDCYESFRYSSLASCFYVEEI